MRTGTDTPKGIRAFVMSFDSIIGQCMAPTQAGKIVRKNIAPRIREITQMTVAAVAVPGTGI